MLPSTGNFKGVNCPFFDSGLCERPYCHFRHIRKETGSPLEPNGDMLEHLVSEAVKKVLMQKDLLPVPANESPPDDLVSQVVDELDLNTSSEELLQETTTNAFGHFSTIPSYNPTPIAELNKKRHIPVPYTPTISGKVQQKRHTSPESTPEHYLLAKQAKLPLSSTQILSQPSPLLEYNPDVDESKYLGYTPSSNNEGGTAFSYTPSAIATLVPPVMDYIPMGTGTVKAIYEPSVVNSKEPEYTPVSSNINPSVNSYIPTDKSKLMEINFDDMLPEFEMLDEILLEHARASPEDVLGNCENENIISASNSETVNVKQKYASAESVKSKFPHMNGDCRSKSCESDSEIEVNGRCDESHSSEMRKILKRDKTIPPLCIKTPSVSEVKDRTKNKLSDKGSHSNHSHSSKKTSSSKNTKHSSSTHNDVSSVKSSSKSETKEDKQSKHKSRHKSKHKPDHRKSSRSEGDSKNRSSSQSSSIRHRKHNSSKSKSSSKNNSTHKSSSAKIEVTNQKLNQNQTETKCGYNNQQQSSDEKESNSIFSDNDLADNISLDSDLDDEEIEQQCLRIFQEYQPTQTENQTATNTSLCKEVSRVTDVPNRKRIAHEGSERYAQVTHLNKRPVVNPSQMIAERFQAAKYLYEKSKEEEAMLKTERLQKMISTDTNKMAVRLQKMRELAERNSDTKPIMTGKIRIAHVPNVDGLLKAKSKVQSYAVKRKQLEELRLNKAEAMKRHEEHVQVTVAQTTPKGSKRMAHMPAAHVLDAPVIIPERGMKILVTMRQKSLNLLVKEHLQFFDKSDAYLQAQEQEKLIYSRATNQMSYTSLISSAILRLRKGMRVGGKGVACGLDINRRTVSHSTMLAGKNKGSWSIEQPRFPVDYDVGTLYSRLVKYILTEEELIQNGFPLPHPKVKGAAIAELRYYKNEAVLPNMRECIRCSKKYAVDDSGMQIQKELCIYHDSKPFQQFNRGRYDASRRYLCCDAGLDNSAGCQEADYHVCTNFQLTNHGFRATRKPTTEPADGDYGVYALDCEMCYTTLGLELIRVTVVDEKSEKVLDKFVLPEGHILDYATKFSGVTEDDLKGVKLTLRELQSELLNMFNSKTILIGHSLDSDLRVLKIIHKHVVDTSIVFPHRDQGKKKALKTLTHLYLRRAIQQSVNGHDSAEDAIAAMDLMMFKLNSEYR